MISSDFMNINPEMLPTTGTSGEFVGMLAHAADKALTFLGINHYPTFALIVYAIMVLGISIVVGIACRWIILKSVMLIYRDVKNDFFIALKNGDFFLKLSNLIPPTVYLILLHLTFSEGAAITVILGRITFIYQLYCAVKALNCFIDVVWVHFDNKENKRKLPLKSLAQLSKGIVWLIAIIITIALLVGKSPASLLAGLGAFAAVLMLVFKDSILGVVAGVQLSEADALHVGDWIAVEGTSVNGIVTEVNLVSVKVENWDMTTTVLPPYSLVSGMFINYQSMVKLGARLLSRDFMIDGDTVVSLTDADLERYKSIPFMKDYITKKIAQRDADKVEDVVNSEGLVDGSIETNLGLYRAYLKMYLDASPLINHELICFVNTEQPTSTGIPLHIHCFAANNNWAPYVATQSVITEHIITSFLMFGLTIFESCSGRDELANGYLEQGNSPADIFGMPADFLNNNGNKNRADSN